MQTLPSIQTKKLAFKVFVKQFRLVSAALVLVVMLASWFIVLKPHLADLHVSRALTQSLTREKERKEVRAAALARATATLNSVGEKDRDKLDLAFPKDIEFPSLWIYFSGLAQASGVELLSIEIEERGESPTLDESGEEPELLKKISLDIETSGSGYATFKRLLKNMETNIPLMDVMSLHYEPTVDSFGFNLVMYVIPEK